MTDQPPESVPPGGSGPPHSGFDSYGRYWRDEPPGSAPPVTRRPAGSGSTLVIEGDVLPRRLRRPSDLMRLVLVLAAAAVVLGGAYFAASTASGLDQDIVHASERLPQPLVFLSSTVGVLGVLALPLASAIDLLIRKRARQLLEAFGAALFAFLLCAALAWWIQEAGSARLLNALTGRPVPGATAPLNGILAALVAYVSVTRLIDRTRWAIAAGLVIGATILANIVTGGITVAAIALSALAGWACGLLTRYSFGTPTTRPSGVRVASALEAAGFPLTVLRASHETAGGRRYAATTRNGDRLEVSVLDRDLEGSGIVSAAWRSLRIRDDAGPSGFTMRARLEHASLQSFAAMAAGAPVPRLEAVSSVGPDAALLAYARIEGRTFAELGGSLTDENLLAAWRALRTLQDSNISHRSLYAQNIVLDASDGVWLLSPDEGAVASSDVSERLDLAELLCTLAMLTNPDRAIATGKRVLGGSQLARALPVLQPFALTPQLRKAIRKRKDLLIALREQLEDLQPEGDVEQIRLERLRPKTLLTLTGGTIAVYLLLTQLARVDLVTLFKQANYWWALGAVIFSAVTYIGATMSLEGFVPEKLNSIRTFQAQLAASFATLVSPPTLGAVAVNVRYLQRAGLHPALAGASVGASQVMAFGTHLILLTIFGVLAGTQSHLEVSPPRWAIFIGIALIFLICLVLIVPVGRRWALRRIQPIFKQVGPRMVTLAQRPTKILIGVGGIAILNVAYCLSLYASVRAFGGGGSLAGIAIVYLAGSTIGQAAPTPGGIGAVEAVIAAGLTAAGVEAGIAVSATLLFRLFTFWLPTIPGWFCFNYLQKINAL